MAFSRTWYVTRLAVSFAVALVVRKRVTTLGKGVGVFRRRYQSPSTAFSIYFPPHIRAYWVVDAMYLIPIELCYLLIFTPYMFQG